jgi:hypothetical protein
VNAGKAALKRPHSKRCRDCHAPLTCAKRLDCGGFTADFLSGEIGDTHSQFRNRQQENLDAVVFVFSSFVSALRKRR